MVVIYKLKRVFDHKHKKSTVTIFINPYENPIRVNNFSICTLISVMGPMVADLAMCGNLMLLKAVW